MDSTKRKHKYFLLQFIDENAERMKIFCTVCQRFIKHSKIIDEHKADSWIIKHIIFA